MLSLCLIALTLVLDTDVEARLKKAGILKEHISKLVKKLSDRIFADIKNRFETEIAILSVDLAWTTYSYWVTSNH